MTDHVDKIPDGYMGVTPYLIVSDGAAAIDFYTRAFDATELYRIPMADNVGHADLMIAGGHVMLATAMPEMQIYGPSGDGTPVRLAIYVSDVDAVFDRAIAEGATVERPVADQFYGDRAGSLVDPFGHQWLIQTRFEEVSPDEMRRRMDALEPMEPQKSSS